MGKYTKMSQQVLEKVGGLSNITFVEHCATRLRIHYAIKSKVDVEAIKGIENVVGVVAKTGQVQIIIGPEVNDAFNDFLDVSGWKPTDDRPTVVEEEPEKKNALYYVNKFGNFCAGIFMPIVPALITGGLILAIKNLLVNYFGMSTDSGTAKVCLAIFSAGFSMLPVWIGYTLSNKLKMEPIMGAFLGAVLVSSSISGVEGLDFFGIPIPTVTYTSSVLPIVMGVILMYWVDKLLKKIIPEMVRYFLKPLLTMLIVVPITLIVLGPIGNTVGTWLANGVYALYQAVPALAVMVIGITTPLMVFFGMNNATYPVVFALMAAVNSDPLICTGMAPANVAVGGACLAASLLSKNVEEKSVSVSAGITALCGITEPGVYGVLFPKTYPLIGAMIGGGIGGLLAGILGMTQYVISTPGFISLPAYIDPTGSSYNLIVSVIVMIVAVVLGFVATYALGKCAEAKK